MTTESNSDFDHLPMWMQRFYRTRYGRWNMRMFNKVADQFRRWIP